jgi:hypothetical protein
MPHDRFEWIDRLKFVEREHRVVATAIERLRRAILDGVIGMPGCTTPRDLAAAGESLEETFLIRLSRGEDGDRGHSPFLRCLVRRNGHLTAARWPILISSPDA